MMKLYYAPRTRGSRPRWMLEELGVPYELVRVDLQKHEQKAPEFRKIHPLGKVPVLTDGNQAIFESGAICAYLADKFSDKGFAPALTSPQRGEYYQWLFFSAATLEPPVMNFFFHTQLFPQERRIPRLADEGRSALAECAGVLDKALQGRTFLLGEQITTPDILVGSLLIFAQRLKLLNGLPELQHYCNRLTERPAFLRANAD